MTVLPIGKQGNQCEQKLDLEEIFWHPFQFKQVPLFWLLLLDIELLFEQIRVLEQSGKNISATFHFPLDNPRLASGEIAEEQIRKGTEFSFQFPLSCKSMDSLSSEVSYRKPVVLLPPNRQSSNRQQNFMTEKNVDALVGWTGIMKQLGIW